ncbi:unnamed protein product [Rhizoctonia solani]|uniref:Phosphatidylserine decarboxylase n=1 Tax=Rhizoctonia solani TaxID=456999 RepID=A0A8H3DLX6_9AGAM|nr:unnamed protein product [Rhizoctonia solani]
MSGVTHLVGKMRNALHQPSSSDEASSPPSSPGPKQEGRERHAKLAQSLKTTIENSDKPESANTIHDSAIAPAKHAAQHAWIRDMFSEQELDSLFAYEHMGKSQYIVASAVILNLETRELCDKPQDQGEEIRRHANLCSYWYASHIQSIVPVGASMKYLRKCLSYPISHLYQTLLGEKRVDKLLRDQSFKQGRIYDREDPAIVQPHIKSFAETYEIDTSQLLQPDLSAYKTFNGFFARRVRPDTRPVDAPEDPGVITSAADCRLTVWNNVATATKVWVKGKHFSVPELLGDVKLSEAKFGTNPSLAIFRLAPADYHRFHTPCAGVFTAPTSQGSKYYTVNPQAVKTGLDVFTANRRDIRIIESNIPSISGLATPVGIVAIGALLVGSVNWADKSEGYRAVKGEDIGWFQYGGSTVIAIFPGDRIKWDDDLNLDPLLTRSDQVRACERIGQAIGAAPS